MKIYISGAISNRDPEEVKKDFHKAEEKFTALGCEVVNPLKNGLTEAHKWEEHMREDLRLLLECDTIALLPGWESSKGARLEHYVATQLYMAVITLIRKED